MRESVNQICEEFQRNGFVVLPNALSEADVSKLNAAIDRHRVAHEHDWVDVGESMSQTVDVLNRTEEFDLTIENENTLAILRKVLGNDLTFEEISIILRSPTAHSADAKGWHRDILRAYDRRHEIDAVSVIFYLTDVGSGDHCFSIIPETHAGRVDLRAEDVRTGMETDVTAAAGSAVIFHARCLHSGKIKAGSRERRTLHLYYSRLGQPRTSEWTDIPARLYQTENPILPPHLYAKWNSQNVLDGTGKKPKGVDVTISNAEMLRIVQARANAKT